MIGSPFSSGVKAESLFLETAPMPCSQIWDKEDAWPLRLKLNPISFLAFIPTSHFFLQDGYQLALDLEKATLGAKNKSVDVESVLKQ